MIYLIRKKVAFYLTEVKEISYKQKGYLPQRWYLNRLLGDKGRNQKQWKTAAVANQAKDYWICFVFFSKLGNNNSESSKAKLEDNKSKPYSPHTKRHGACFWLASMRTSGT